MNTIMLATHVIAGSLALAGLLICYATRKGGVWHRRSGRMYSYSMAAALLAALVLSLLEQNWMLLVIAFFSAYLVYTGWRAGAVREIRFSIMDKFAVFCMLLTALVMFALAFWMHSNEDSMSVTVAVFGAIGGGFALRDALRLGIGWPGGRERISLHLSRMGGASIGTITAVFVVNVETDPAFIAWILPTIIITPVIAYWGIRTKGGKDRLPHGVVSVGDFVILW